MNKTTLFETTLSKPKKIEEKKDTVKFVTILQSLDKPGENGRIYPLVLLEKQIKKQEPKMKNRMWYGELDHPNTEDTERIYTVSLKEQSHQIVNQHIENGQVIGEIETLPTPNGLIVKSLILNGNTLGVSSRSLGSLKESADGYQIVEDLDLVTYDIVSNPSFTEQVFNKKRLIESVEYVIKESEQIQNEIFKIAFIEEVKTLFERFGMNDDRYQKLFIKFLKDK